MNQDEQHLHLLSIFHYILAGLSAVVSLFPLIHLALGIMMVTIPGHHGPGTPEPELVGWFFIGFAILFILFGLTFSGFVFATARFLSKRRHPMFCLVMAGIECLLVPYGTILGILTIIVLMRDSVNALFQAQTGPS
jgi:hypothetical protein